MPDWIYYEKGIKWFSEVINELGMPKKINDYSKELYKSLIDKRLTRGRNKESVIGACIYIACQEHNYPIRITDLGDKKDLVRQSKFIKKHLDIKARVSVESYINNYATGLTPSELSKALRAAKIIEKQLINCKPEIKAAVSIYIASNKSLRDLVELTGLSKSGLYNAYKLVKDLKPSIDLLAANDKMLIIKKNK